MRTCIPFSTHQAETFVPVVAALRIILYVTSKEDEKYQFPLDDDVLSDLNY